MAPTALTPGVSRPIPVDNVNVTSKVTITVPTQADRGSVSFTTEPAVSLAGLADPTAFKPKRLVMNLRLSKAGAINPPVKLSIEITSSDVARAGGNKFKVGYHNGQQWVVLKDNIACAAGNTEVELSKVGDPPIALAP